MGGGAHDAGDDEHQADALDRGRRFAERDAGEDGNRGCREETGATMLIRPVPSPRYSAATPTVSPIPATAAASR